MGKKYKVLVLVTSFLGAGLVLLLADWIANLEISWASGLDDQEIKILSGLCWIGLVIAVFIILKRRSNKDC